MLKKALKEAKKLGVKREFDIKNELGEIVKIKMTVVNCLYHICDRIITWENKFLPKNPYLLSKSQITFVFYIVQVRNI